MNATAAQPPPVMDPNGGPPNGRYEYLLQQVVQLNTDLHKTVALSQSLKAERDSLQELTNRLKQDVMRCEERCEKMQEVLMTETEFKVQSDRKHEALMHKWKQQLEIKAREFEVLQKNLAPPKDLDQLRLAIQEEVELPHRQRTQALQLEIEKFREMYYTTRREFEILKTEHEQTLVNHGNEIESTLATHAVLMNDLKRQVDAAEERADDIHLTEKVRRMELDKEALVLENLKLRQELEHVRQAKLDLFQRQEADATKHAQQLTEALGKITNLDLELNATTRQLGRFKDDCERLQGAVDEKDRKLRDALDDSMKLREQVKQKDLLLVDNHSLHNTKLRELRAELDADKTQFKERQLEWMEQIATLQLSLQQSEATFQKREKEWQMEHAKQLALHSHDETHTQHTTSALETKLAQKVTELAALEEAHDERIQRATHALEQEQLKTHRLQGEKDSLTAKLATTQELVTKLKAETLSWRTQHKEMEQEYRILQAKHRDAIQAQEDVQSQLDQEKAKIQYLEEDLVKLTEQRASDKEVFDKAQARLQAHVDETLAASFTARRTMTEDHKKALDKVTKALSKAEHKRDAYKQKCLQVHDRYKAAIAAKDAVKIQLHQLQEQHHLEVQQFLAQWTHSEESRTTSALLPGKQPVDTKLDSFLAEVDQYNQTRSPRLS
ncbi:hypothetical protein H310_05277 [Aphanomyces invadans]|uniref:Uncharacterized protein n=1 Tax=Aphanomyces invadans TaxID=157072 RepID=A0A024UAX8_9STRA|nr:hypothetical protein H310_05277 [Aphanomyces invadans]ETW02788.1 hypothetical protein H310_05277 [Aphanomyces invadans]|eukprot:XP_008868172.1 hypothetical protein H310_05277 [Aphanomyces invadans]